MNEDTSNPAAAIPWTFQRKKLGRRGASGKSTLTGAPGPHPEGDLYRNTRALGNLAWKI
jgi:hypothetical protein